MTTASVSLENPIMNHVGTGPGRTAQDEGSDDFLPKGTVLVSADDHWEVTEDIFHQELPEHLKDIGPRIWFNEVWWHVPREKDAGEEIPANVPAHTFRLLKNLYVERGFERDKRVADMKAEGLAQAIVYANQTLGFLHHPNLELREEMFRIYNRYVARERDHQRGFHPVPIFPNWWDETKAESQLQELVDMGFKTLQLPTQPRLPDGTLVSYADKRFDRFWTALERTGIPLSLHIGENFSAAESRGLVGGVMHILDPFRLPLGQMIFGGVFDRHPDVSVVFAEGGIAWVAPALQDAELIYDTFACDLEPLKHRPSYYWHKNCYATFMTDVLGLSRHLDILGADRIMWAADYPHSEGTYGFTRDSIRQVIEHAGPDNARMILGGTAIKLYNLD